MTLADDAAQAGAGPEKGASADPSRHQALVYERPPDDELTPAAEGRSAGRPYGTKASVVLPGQQVLRHGHFSFVRWALEGGSMREAWERFLAHAGGVNDARYFERRLREIAAQIHVAAKARSSKERRLDDLAEVALSFVAERQPRELDSEAVTPMAAEPSAAGAPAASGADVPQLDEWIAQRCDEMGIDRDFQGEADWLEEYLQEFGLDVEASARSATAALPGEEAKEEKGADLAQPAPLKVRLDALNILTTYLAVPPALGDGLDAWLAPEMCERLRQVGVVTIANLADYIDVHRHRWHARVPGLGAVRARRLVAWLAPLVAELQRPLRDVALRPARQLAITRDLRLATLDPLRLKRYGIVPLERLAVPPELNGRQGTFRVQGPNTLGVDDDLAAVLAWLRRYVMSPRTYRSYRGAAETFYLWCVWVRRKPMSSLVEADLHEFRQFLSAPTPGFIQPRHVERDSDEWRPMRGPLDPIAQRHRLSVIGGLYKGLVDAGYLSAQPVRGVIKHLVLPRPKVNVRRSFTEEQWTCVMRTVATLPDRPGTRRLRLVLELGTTTGLRLIELCTARLRDLRQERAGDGDDGRVWMLHVVGKGRRERDVVVYDDIKELIDQHQADMDAAGVEYDPRAPLRTLDPSLQATDGALLLQDALGHTDQRMVPVYARSEPSEPTEKQWRPIIGALRRPVPRWTAGQRGEVTLEKDVAPFDAGGAIEPSALYQSIKRLFALAAERAASEIPPLDPAKLQQASVHWMRHFFAQSALDDGVKPAVLRDAMGHADLRTTSVYLKTEQRALIAEMKKMRRRGQ